jgi:hypothetical protein
MMKMSPRNFVVHKFACECPVHHPLGCPCSDLNALRPTSYAITPSALCALIEHWENVKPLPASFDTANVMVLQLLGALHELQLRRDHDDAQQLLESRKKLAG